MRPPHLLIASPALAECLARSTHELRTHPQADAASLEPFHHLVCSGEPEHTPCEPSAHSRELIRQDAARLRRLTGERAYARPLRGSTVVYRLEAGGHRQTGVVVEASVEDYRSGRIRRHEATHPDRESLLVHFLSAAQTELVPVILVHPTRPRLQTLLAAAAAGEPDVRLGSDDGLSQTGWVVQQSEELARAIWEEVDALGTVYIADGHHRMAAAERHARHRGPDTGNRAADYVLCALFPSGEARVFGYHRCVPRNGLRAPDLLATLARQPAIERLQEYTPTQAPHPRPGVVAMWLQGRWYELRLRSNRDAADAHASLDIVGLENGVLGAVLQVDDAGSDPRVIHVPGNIGAAAFADWCQEHDAIGFRVHPPTIEQIMAVSDAGGVMPPKSTWFDPKGRAGPFVRDISASADRGQC